MVKNSGGVLVSDIALGALVIGPETTVADLASAVIAYNAGFEAGDQLTFFYGQQTTDAVTGIPRARIYGFKVMLNPGDSALLYEQVSEIGFSSVPSADSGQGYVLGMSVAIADGAAVWVHSREDGTSGLKVSTQFLYVDSSVLAAYQGSTAFAGAANSYGGINTSAVYLNPRSSGAGAGSVVTPVVPSSGGSSGSNGSSETGGDTGGSNTGGQTGGSDTGGTTGGNTGGNTGGGDNTGGGGEDEPGGDDH